MGRGGYWGRRGRRGEVIGYYFIAGCGAWVMSIRWCLVLGSRGFEWRRTWRRRRGRIIGDLAWRDTDTQNTIYLARASTSCVILVLSDYVLLLSLSPSARHVRPCFDSDANMPRLQRQTTVMCAWKRKARKLAEGTKNFRKRKMR